MQATTPKSANCQGNRTLSCLRGWVPLLVLPVGVCLATPTTVPRWVFMWLLAIVIFAGCKWLSWRRTVVVSAWWQQLSYLIASPGFDAAAFLQPASRTRIPEPSGREWLLAGGNILLGATLFLAVPRFLPATAWLAIGWFGMVGLILMLHFGVIHLISCGWREFGIDARPLMDWPVCSASLAEFWGRRWNTAFRDLTHRFLFRPLSSSIGPRAALLFGFLCSGLVHELVITVPAGGGYGGPTIYFILQGLGLLAERSRFGRAHGLGRAPLGRFFAILFLIAPVGLLFPSPFVHNVVLPMMSDLHAIPTHPSSPSNS